MIKNILPTILNTPVIWRNKSELNSYGFRTSDFTTVDHSQQKILTFGCSHTEGIGVDRYDNWPEQLKIKLEINQLFNLGQAGASIDYIHRIMPYCLEYFRPNFVFILWPSYLRFEYIDKGIIKQSLPTDYNRIEFMETYTDEWCQENYKKKLNEIKLMCQDKNIPAFCLEINDLHSVIDHGDRWILAADNSHFDKNWHRIIAEIFRYKFIARHLYN